MLVTKADVLMESLPRLHYQGDHTQEREPLEIPEANMVGNSRDIMPATNGDALVESVSRYQYQARKVPERALWEFPKKRMT
jgi:hypothetical protein